VKAESDKKEVSREELIRRVEELQLELARVKEASSPAAESEERETNRRSRTGSDSPTQDVLERANDDLRDLTENLDKIVRRRTQALVESEEQLRLSNEELQRLNQNKREFVSIAAHELRTPLTSMVGYLELMAEGRFGKISPKMQRPMLSVRRNAQRLRRLVDEMLDVSRIEADRMSIKKSRCNVGEIGAAVVQELLPLAETKKQVINCDTQGSPDVEADADKIHQIISNLVSNSLRYCPPGGIVDILIDRAPAARYPGNWARVRVRDNGPGINADDLDAIFEPFSDVNPAKYHSSRGPAAAGLGLYIARGLVDLHEGIITVESEPGTFTEFAVLLPSLE
jgi:signal transduction histidine kinase